ncbi:MAG: cytochrome c oxidase assembly protein [Bryobacteraceae bacterium]|nr:MAG: cytochrome c oxidase assembly protein [Bryobacteraceae bacterium]
MLPVLWFWIVAVMIAMYVVLDGFDLGAGIVHLAVARTDAERRAVLKAIGPVWDGNEVWLLAGGGTLYFAFPALYSSSFSGFYLPLMVVLWLLILRGTSVEFRSHIQNAVWLPMWDVIFSLASALLAIFFGAALGNVVRGVPLDEKGEFFLPLWTNFQPGREAGILDWYTILIGVYSFAVLMQHGALWIAYKTEGAVQERARAIAQRAWYVMAALTVIVTITSFRLQPKLAQSFAQWPVGYVFPALALVSLILLFLYERRQEDLKAFLASTFFLLGMLTSVVFGVFPMVLPANTDPALSLTIYNASAPEYGLKVGLGWFIPGLLIAAFYFWFLYRRFAGKVQAEAEGY